jgi:uncharacterized protein YgbK (DUF1537 family)
VTTRTTAPAVDVAFYGDDFTGSTDTLATLAAGGRAAMLFLGVPTDDQLAAAGNVDALGIAGAARSMTPAAMRDELVPVGRFFRALAAPVIHYKTCSTFDSAPHVGSIGVAVSVLRTFVDDRFVPIVGGQPNLGRYCVFGNLFAAAEAGGPVVRIDRHPTMRAHPVTPMDEADLRIHLAAQGLARVASIEYTAYDQPEPAQDAMLERMLVDRPDAVLFDVGHPSHLRAVGRMLWTRASNASLLAVGPSGVTQALLAHWGQQTNAGRPQSPRPIAPARGPVFVLAGSQSPVTARQVEAAASYAHEPLDAGRLLANDGAYATQWLARVASLLRDGRNVLAYTAPATGRVAAEPELAAACGALVARLLQSTPLTRVGIAGGDTSSHCIKALAIWGLSHLGNLAPGVALCRAHADVRDLDGVEFMLKGGQMGPADLYDQLSLRDRGPVAA